MCSSDLFATQLLLDEIQSYRLITPRNIVGDIDKYIEAFRRVKIEDCSQGNGKTFAEAADFIFEKAQSANSVLAIVNTKKAAKEIAMRIQKLIPDSEEYELFHLSTNMCPAHRSSVIQKLKAALQRKGRKAKVICVSTTLIEAGVDVSFEGVVRSLTGFDSIVQAAGRCNRTGKRIAESFLLSISTRSGSKKLKISKAPNKLRVKFSIQ